ncbi:LysM peptidoglycan-binding domain-containing protein [Bacillus sp. FJAT-28004]|uniref:cell division suppressor protein YneA n=1 Tax=Bacillus sp. FJAT-28004 TaxID=1679165 RepID=UPI0006B547C0|nr:LysM peptidoglycan-binding domain-containing protein [Bacillus sp. FJAT-28004]
MITSPSFYRTIHKQDANKATKINHSMRQLMKRHAAKLVVCTGVFILLFTSFLLMGTYASSNTPEAATAEEQSIRVQSGDTLWNIAKQFSDGSQDIRYIVFLIKDRNNLQSTVIKPGQKLIIPSI